MLQSALTPNTVRRRPASVPPPLSLSLSLSPPRAPQVFVLLLVFCFIFEMAGSAYTLSNGIYHSKMYPWLQNQLTGMVARYSYDKDARWVLDMIQVTWVRSP